MSQHPSKRSQNLLKIFLGTIFSRGLTAAGSIVLSVQLAHQLPLDDFGRFSFCLTLLVALTILARYGCDVSLLRFAGAAWHQQDIHRFAEICRYSLRLTTKLSLVLTLLGACGLIVAHWFGWRTAMTMLVMILALLPSTLIYVVSSCFKSAQRPQLGGLFEIGFISMVCGLAAALMSYLGMQMTAEGAAGLFVIICFLVGLTGLAFVYRSWLAGQHGEPKSGFDVAEFLRASHDFTVISNAQVLGNWGGLLLLGVFRDEAEVGLYSAALRTALIPSLLVNVVVSICSPRLSGLNDAGDHREFRRLARTSATGIFLINFPVLVLTICLSKPLMHLFGSSFEPHAYLLAIVAVGLMAQTLTALASSILSMAGRQRIVRRVTVMTAGLATLLSAQLIYSWGATGAAIGFAVYSTLHPVIMAIIVKRELGFWPTPLTRIRSGGMRTAVGQGMREYQ